jgi:hypothetical protein
LDEESDAEKPSKKVKDSPPTESTPPASAPNRPPHSVDQVKPDVKSPDIVKSDAATATTGMDSKQAITKSHHGRSDNEMTSTIMNVEHIQGPLPPKKKARAGGCGNATLLGTEAILISTEVEVRLPRFAGDEIRRIVKDIDNMGSRKTKDSTGQTAGANWMWELLCRAKDPMQNKQKEDTGTVTATSFRRLGQPKLNIVARQF